MAVRVLPVQAIKMVFYGLTIAMVLKTRYILFLLFPVITCTFSACEDYYGDGPTNIFTVSPTDDTLDIALGEHIHFCYELTDASLEKVKCRFQVWNEDTGELIITGGFPSTMNQGKATHCWDIYVDGHFVGVYKIRSVLRVMYGQLYKDTTMVENIYILQ